MKNPIKTTTYLATLFDFQDPGFEGFTDELQVLKPRKHTIKVARLSRRRLLHLLERLIFEIKMT